MNKVIIMTGGSSGIGKCTADMFRAEGDLVLSIAREIDEEYKDFSFVCNVSNEEEVKNVITAIGEKYGRIDVLVNCAGFGVSGALELIPTETFRKIMDVNVLGVHLCSKYALPYMEKGSKIINISSACGIWSVPFRGMYCTSKAAVLFYSYAQRMELSEAGIDVCAICPGDVKSNFSKNRVKNFETNERYGDRVEQAVAFVDRHEEKRMPPERVATVIVKQAYKKKSAPMKIVSRSFNVFHFLLRFFPVRFELFMINKLFGGGKLQSKNKTQNNSVEENK